MRNVNFVSEDKDFEIGNCEYTQGDSGVAEMCKVHCKAQGRGHIHLLPCQKQKRGHVQKTLTYQVYSWKTTTCINLLLTSNIVVSSSHKT
jgi:hypothetical protein